MTTKDVVNILLYHNKGGFEKDFQLLLARIEDYKKICDTIISCAQLKLAVPSNKNSSSTVEANVMSSQTVLELQVQANELKRFIDRLNWVLENLPEVEQLIIKLRYFNPRNRVKQLYNVAAEINYSNSRCEKLHVIALNRIRKELEGVSISWGRF